MFQQAMSVCVLFCLGFAGRRFAVFSTQDAQALSKIVLYVTMPAIAFIAVSDTTVGLSSMLVLPGLAFVIPLILLSVSLLTGRGLGLPRETLGVFLTSATVANIGYFLYPFFDLFYGTSGLAHLAVFDIGNTIMAYSVAYYIALLYAKDRGASTREQLRQIAKFPPLWATLLGLAYGLASRQFLFHLPSFLLEALSVAGRANSLLAMLVLGMYFTPRVRYPIATMTAVAIRIVGGLCLGTAAATVLGLTGMDRIVISLAPGMPVGLNNLIYAVKHDLDVEFAASLVAVSMTLGFIVLFLATQLLI